MAEETQQEQINKVGDYDLVTVIASGTSCDIWEAVQGNQTWAVKLMIPDKLPEAEERNSLKHEAKVLESLQHPGFVQYRDASITKKEAYMVMEYFRAPNLKSAIKTSRVSVHTQFAKLLEQVCLALGYMHENGWVHRDVKPDNILITKAGDIKLIDFSLTTKAKSGISAMLSGKAKTIQGTRTYIAPETVMKKNPTPQTDMYSLGITLYEALTGRTPFSGSTPNDLLIKHVMEKPHAPSNFNPNVAPDLDEFILRLLKKKPQDRFKDMNEAYMAIRSMKLFREDPAELASNKAASDKAENETTYENVLDSRRDAERTELGVKLPPKVRKKKEPVKILSEEKKKAEAAKAQQAAPQQPQMPPPGYGYPPGYYPPMPGQPQPQYQYPPQGAYPQWQYPPGQMPPGQFPPGQMPPGQPMPPGQMPPGQMPAQSGQQPSQGAPPQQAPPQQQPAGQQPPPPAQAPEAPPQQAAPPPAQPAKKAAQPNPAQQKPQKKQGDDLPLMDELPEVI